MKKVKILSLLCVGLMLMSSVAFAARGGVRFRPKAPAISSPAKKAPVNSFNKSANKKPNQGAYKPSQKAANQTKDAPKSNMANNTAAAKTANSPSPWGGIMRNVGLLAGGMLLGGLLSSLFGMGASGLFADILGLLANVAIFFGIFMLGKFLWNKFRRRKNEENIYQTSRQVNFQNPQNLKHLPKQPIMDIRPPKDEENFSYDAREMADRYRRQ